MNGMISGGWAYVWAAYAVTGVAFAWYTVATLVRVRSLR
jgi:heme exporter protein D